MCYPQFSDMGPITKHGFARVQGFAVESQAEDSVTLVGPIARGEARDPLGVPLDGLLKIENIKGGGHHQGRCWSAVVSG